MTDRNSRCAKVGTVQPLPGLYWYHEIDEQNGRCPSFQLRRGPAAEWPIHIDVQEEDDETRIPQAYGA